jgi:23S rRNA maturation mini-RNase III
MTQSHERMIGPFICKAERIERNLARLKDEKIPEELVGDLSDICRKWSRVQEHCIPQIGCATSYTFSHPSLFRTVFLYREICNFFNKIAQPRKNPGEVSNLDKTELKEMLKVSKDLFALAFIGDAALDLAVLDRTLYDNETGIPTKSFLDKQRRNHTGNIPLTRLWKALELYDEKILLPHPEDNEKTTGTYMEAVFGIIYLEGGLEAVEYSLQNLEKSCKVPC